MVCGAVELCCVLQRGVSIVDSTLVDINGGSKYKKHSSILIHFKYINFIKYSKPHLVLHLETRGRAFYIFLWAKEYSEQNIRPVPFLIWATSAGYREQCVGELGQVEDQLRCCTPDELQMSDGTWRQTSQKQSAKRTWTRTCNASLMRNGDAVENESAGAAGGQLGMQWFLEVRARTPQTSRSTLDTQ